MSRDQTGTIELGLFISEIKKDGYYHISAVPVTIDAQRKLRNADIFKGGLYVDNLQVWSQGNQEDRAQGLYGFDVSFKPYKVDRTNADKIAKTLKTIERRLDKLTEARGYITSYGEYVARVAEVIGATTIIFTMGKSAGWSYDDADYRFQTLGHGRSQIDSMIRNWKDCGDSAGRVSASA